MWASSASGLRLPSFAPNLKRKRGGWRRFLFASHIPLLFQEGNVLLMLFPLTRRDNSQFHSVVLCGLQTNLQMRIEVVNGSVNYSIRLSRNYLALPNR